MREHELLEATLLELEHYLGCAGRQWITDKNIRWEDDFLLGGMLVGSKRVWRLTAQTPSEFAPLIEPAPPHVGESNCPNVTVPVQLHVHATAACTIKFQNASLEASGVSRFGERYDSSCCTYR